MTVERQQVLVTGASRGLGRALAEHFLSRGASVFGCARGDSDLRHPDYLHVACDLCDSQQVASLLATVRQTAGKLDVLINNAGAARMVPFALTPPATARRLMDVNFHSVFELTHGAVRLLRRAPHPRVVNFSTVAVPWRLAGEAAYVASKAAVEALTRVLAQELGEFRITCNAVGPSPIRTDLLKHVSEDKLQALIERQAIRKWATPEDVLHVVDFLCSPASDLVTGQVIYLGGAG